jgi:hypothetical protein
MSRYTALFFHHGHAIEFRKFSADFASELRRRFEQQTAQITPTLPANAPVAFLCHENRDTIKAEVIAAGLRERGIDYWLDKQSLRGGDNWAKLIPIFLKEQCD